jgi:hypothetical protein
MRSATYLLTPHLSLGGAFGLSFSYSRTKQRAPGQPNVTNRSYTGSLGTLSLDMTLCF